MITLGALEQCRVCSMLLWNCETFCIFFFLLKICAYFHFSCRRYVGRICVTGGTSVLVSKLAVSGWAADSGPFSPSYSGDSRSRILSCRQVHCKPSVPWEVKSSCTCTVGTSCARNFLMRFLFPRVCQRQCWGDWVPQFWETDYLLVTFRMFDSLNGRTKRLEIYHVFVSFHAGSFMSRTFKLLLICLVSSNLFFYLFTCSEVDGGLPFHGGIYLSCL